MSEERFFNFPIAMMQNVRTNEQRQTFLQNLLYYHLAKHSERIEDLNEYDETDDQRFKRSADYYSVNLVGGITQRRKSGENLIEKYYSEKVLTGINIKVFWEYYKNDKSEFEWHCLFAYLGLKSIIGNKDFAKSNNMHLLARMSGFTTKEYLDSDSLSFNRYQFEKIKKNLQYYWHLNYYATYTRGFYFSFDNKCNLNNLVLEAEKRKKKNKDDKLKKDKEQARQMALKKIRESPP